MNFPSYHEDVQERLADNLHMMQVATSQVAESTMLPALSPEQRLEEAVAQANSLRHELEKSRSARDLAIAAESHLRRENEFLRQKLARAEAERDGLVERVCGLQDENDDLKLRRAALAEFSSSITGVEPLRPRRGR